MKIKIVRENFGAFYSGHVTLYAWSESKDDFFEFNNQKRYAIKLDFYNNNDTMIHAVSGPDSYYENHNAVIFDSSKKFSDFYSDLNTSQFANGRHFDWIRNNCVDSVKFALKIAHIDIDFDDTYHCKHIIACFCCPSSRTTPRELILALKEEKNKVCNQQTVVFTEKQREQIRNLENKAIQSERISMMCALTSSFTFTMLAQPNLLSIANNLLSLIGNITCVTFTCGIASPLIISSFFHNRADSEAKEIEEKYREIYGEIKPRF